MNTDKLATARSHLASIHEETAQLWLITRKCSGVDTVEVDEQFDVVTSRIMDLGFVLDQLMGAELSRGDDLPAVLPYVDDELDPTDPQRMTVADWPVANGGASRKTARSSKEEPDA